MSPSSSRKFRIHELKLPMSASTLLPQSGPMLLVDEAVFISEDEARSRTRIKPDCILLDQSGRLPGSALIEMMAQTIGIYAGAVRAAAGLEPSIGLLLGTRDMKIFFEGVEPDDVVFCSAKKTFESDEGLWQFDVDARLEDESGTRLLAQAAITVYNAPQEYIDSLMKS